MVLDPHKEKINLQNAHQDLLKEVLDLLKEALDLRNEQAHDLLLLDVMALDLQKALDLQNVQAHALLLLDVMALDLHQKKK